MDCLPEKDMCERELRKKPWWRLLREVLRGLNAKEDKAERISLESHMFLDHVSVQVEREPGPVLFLFSVF